MSPVDDTHLADFLPRLDPQAREAVMLALGEAARIRRPWLGLEFLLCGLSRREDGPLARLAAEWGVDPHELRAVCQRCAGPDLDEDWSRHPVASLGEPLLAAIEAGRVRVGLTPRAAAVLHDACGLAGGAPVGAAHLLAAALHQAEATPVRLLLAAAEASGWPAERVERWLAEQPAAEPAPAAGPDAPSPEPSPPRAAPASGQPPALAPLSGLLGKLAEQGHDLTAEALAARIRMPIGMEGALLALKRSLIAPDCRAALIVGEAGVGKTALVHGLACQIASGTAGHELLAGRHVVEVTYLDLTAGTHYRGDLEERVQRLLAEVTARSDVIVFFDEIHSVLGGGDESRLVLANALKPALARGAFPCIGATTLKEYQRTIERDEALNRRFRLVRVEEPDVDTAIAIVSRVYPHLPAAAVREAVHLAARYLRPERLPASALKLLGQAQVYVQLPSVDTRAGPQQGAPRYAEVGPELIRHLVEKQTGIPLTALRGDDLKRLAGLEQTLAAQVIGQEEAVRTVAEAVLRARAGLGDPQRPLGVFLFVGPTGVGKTELAKALARALFGSAGALLRFDMSEYIERHQVARLIGSPPGYVGYEEEGQLTGKLRTRPFSVVLIDEIEKAHPDVHGLFLQLFDAGRLTDARGNTADGREAIFIMTSNAGSEAYSAGRMGFPADEPLSTQWIKARQEQVEEALRRTFRPEFLNRVDSIVHFRPLRPQDVDRILDLRLREVQERWQASKRLTLDVRPAARDRLCKEGYDPALGARELARAVERELSNPIARLIVAGDIQEGDQVVVDSDGQALTFTIGGRR